jgi:excisionase family DNA binding protein
MIRKTGRKSFDTSRHRQFRALCQHLRAAIDLLEQIAVEQTSTAEVPDETPRVVQPAPADMPISKLAFSIKEAAKALGISRSALYVQLSRGEIETFNIGRRRLISAEYLREWLAARRKVIDSGCAPRG